MNCSTQVRPRTRLRDRESGDMFFVTSAGHQIVKYRALTGSVHGEVLRESLEEVFEKLDPTNGCDA
jgi:hypothetical protein